MLKTAKKQENELREIRATLRREFARMGKRLDSLITHRESAHLRKYVDMGFRAMTATLGAIHEEVLGLRTMNADIDELRSKVARMERRIGLAKHA